MKCASSATLAVLAVGMLGMASAQAQEPKVGIEAPKMGEVVYQNSLELNAFDETAAGNSARWALRQGTCAASTGTVAGNVDGYADQFDWNDGEFSADVDASSLLGGEYCFVLNTQQGSAAGNRLTQVFYIVDDYAKVGGTIHLDDDRGDGPPRGASPTDTVEGVVGMAGVVGVVGAISVNYRQSGIHKTYDASQLSFRAAIGIGVSNPMAVADIGTDDGDTILVLDRGASSDFPRGALIVRPAGWRSDYDEALEIDSTPGATGADSWVPMERGNNHVGTR